MRTEAQLAYYKNLPSKRIASGVLFLDRIGQILIVKPIYRQDWLIPGGIVEEHESPREACLREVREELGQNIVVGQLLCIDYNRIIPQKTESVQFVFYGGILAEPQIKRFALQASELSAFRFVPLEEAMCMVNAKLALRLPHCVEALRTGKSVYLEDGQPNT